MYTRRNLADSAPIDPLQLETPEVTQFWSEDGDHKQFCFNGANEPCSHAVQVEHLQQQIVDWQIKYNCLLQRFEEIQAENGHLRDAMGNKNTVTQFAGEAQAVEVEMEPVPAGDPIEIKHEPIEVKQEPIEDEHESIEEEQEPFGSESDQQELLPMEVVRTQFDGLRSQEEIVQRPKQTRRILSSKKSNQRKRCDFSCSKCSQVFDNKIDLTAHIRIVHRARKWKQIFFF